MDVHVGPALIVCFLMVSMTAVKSQIREGPKNALTKVGDNVTLACVTVNKNCDKVDWQKVEGLQSPKLVYRDGKGILNNDLYPPQRYSVNSTSGCSLTIRQLEINDSGRFLCIQARDSGEETRTAILIVISVTESCMSNVTSNALDKGDGYSFWCAINIPAKSVEPSDVALVLPTETVGEINTTTNGTQPRTTLNGTATKENITQRVCRASFPPNTQANYDITTAFLDICATQQLIVSYPVENPSVSLVPGKDDTVRCTADGHPPPTFKWTRGKGGAVVDGNTVLITDPRDNYTCIATNTFKGTPVSRSVPYEVVVTPPPPSPCLLSAPGCGSGDIVGIVIGIVGSGIIGYASYAGFKDKRSRLYVWLHSGKKKKNGDCPVENIFMSVSPSGPDKGITVRCTADGHPSPTFKWTNSKAEVVADGDTLLLKGDVEDKYTCTATNTVNGKETSQNITIEFTSPPPEDNKGERANDLSNDLTSASLVPCRTCEAPEME